MELTKSINEVSGIAGSPLVQLDKRGVALFAYGQGLVFLVGGIVGVLLGYYVAGFATLIAPLLLWFGRSLSATRLVFTTQGVYHVRGRGFAQTPQLVQSVEWPSIRSVKLVTETKSSGNRRSTSHTLVFERGNDEPPFRYLVGLVQTKRLVAVAQACKERNIPVRI